MSEKRLTKAELNKTWFTWICWAQICYNYERMMGLGFCHTMSTAINKLYADNEEERKAALVRHMAYYNTENTWGAIVPGIVCSLEEARANGENVDPQAISNLKTALMGPLAGIGDTIQGVLITPPFNIIAASLAAEGNWASILVSTLPLLALFIARWPLFNYGYKQGVNIIEDVSGVGKFDKLQHGSSILGCTVMGGFVPSMLNVKLPIKIGKDLVNEAGEIIQEAKTLQQVLDGIMPCLVPVVFTGICYYLVKFKKAKPLISILIVALVSFVLGAIGWIV